MAHATLNPESTFDTEYRLLQERLDRNVTGAPDSEAMLRVLCLLFSPEEAHIARQLPQLVSLPALVEKLGVDADELGERITSMARRGLVLDFERDGTRYVVATPVVIGFFEFTFMRPRPEAPMDRSMPRRSRRCSMRRTSFVASLPGRPRLAGPWCGKRSCLMAGPRSSIGRGRPRLSAPPRRWQ